MAYSLQYAPFIPNTMLYEVFDALVDAGRFEETFYDHMLKKKPLDFAEYMKDAAKHAWLIMKDSTFAGMVWLTDVVNGGKAQAHFFFLPHIHPVVMVRLARFAVAYLLYLKEDKGDYILHYLHGITPMTHVKALKLLPLVGFKHVGVLPGACFIHNAQRLMPAKLTCATRDSVPIAWLYAGDIEGEKGGEKAEEQKV